MRSMAWIFGLATALVPSTTALALGGEVVAFPGADGFGAAATGGRGGRVLVVDRTADDPRQPSPGTLRWACESESGPRIVVFRTAGIIELAQSIVVRHPDLTNAAQTAPGDWRIVRQVSEGTGRIIDMPGDVGGYPAYRANGLLSDADQDGMPDLWEQAHKLDPRRADANGHDLDPHYDNIEVYFNGLFGEAAGARDRR